MKKNDGLQTQSSAIPQECTNWSSSGFTLGTVEWGCLILGAYRIEFKHDPSIGAMSSATIQALVLQNPQNKHPPAPVHLCSMWPCSKIEADSLDILQKKEIDCFFSSDQ